MKLFYSFTHFPGWFKRARLAWVRKNVTDFMVHGEKRAFTLVYADNGKLYSNGGFERVDREMGFTRSFVRWWKMAVDNGYELTCWGNDANGVKVQLFHMEDRVHSKWCAKELASGFDPVSGAYVDVMGTARRAAFDAGTYDPTKQMWNVDRQEPVSMPDEYLNPPQRIAPTTKAKRRASRRVAW